MKKLAKKAQNLKILAPAGDWECLITAVDAGADYVYFGIKNFNMRSTGAKNFSLADLPKIVEYCGKNNVGTYLTVNTLMYDSDLDKMRKVIDKAYEAKCTGIIVSDFAAIQYGFSKGLNLNISTQLSISNIEAVRFFSKYSNRIILARELTLKQIKKIVKQIEKEKILGPNGKLVEIEIFGHGALCVGVSGRCNMSLYCYGASANRGECTQVCRRKYKVTDLETGHELVLDNEYIMSPKDLCTIGLLPEIIDTGVSVLKLEGRGRPPEYVDTVVRCYRDAIDSISNESYSNELITKLNKRLGTVFNRGLNTGMYLGRNVDEWAKGPGNQSKERRVFAGKILHFFTKKQIALIKIQGNITAKEGDKCLIIGEKTGLVKTELNSMIIDGKKVKKVSQNDEFTMFIGKKVRKNDKVYLLQTV